MSTRRSMLVGLMVCWCLSAVVAPSGWAAPYAESIDPALGLPPIAASGPLSAARIALGRKLFMDPRLSRDGSIACGSCHIPEHAFTVNRVPTAIGIDGRRLRRNSPTVLNVGFNSHLFHDGRETRLEEQLWGPLLASDEMGNSVRASVVQRTAELPGYPGLFEQAFPGQGISPETIAAALVEYERSLVSAGSRFDRWFFDGETEALSPAERRGYVLFRGKAHCDACHTIEARHALFSDDGFHNLGVGVPQSGVLQSAGAPVADTASGVPAELISKLTGVTPTDLGRFEVTGVNRDRFAYRTPTLRNVELTTPYMHDGSLATLRDVVDFYDRGGNVNPGLDDFMMPLFLSEREKEDLVAFMRSLTGANVNELAAQARAAASTPSFR